MPGTPTPRLSLPTLSGTDLVSGFPAAYLPTQDILDNAVLVTEGTLASRPAATALPAGNEYYATDVDIVYKTDGTNWMRTAVPDVSPTQPTRTYGTAYQPNGIRPTLVVWAAAQTSGTSDQIVGFIGSTSATPLGVASMLMISGASVATFTFLVPPAWFYKVTTSGTPLAPSVTEFSL